VVSSRIPLSRYFRFWPSFRICLLFLGISFMHSRVKADSRGFRFRFMGNYSRLRRDYSRRWGLVMFCVIGFSVFFFGGGRQPWILGANSVLTHQGRDGVKMKRLGEDTEIRINVLATLPCRLPVTVHHTLFVTWVCGIGGAESLARSMQDVLDGVDAALRFFAGPASCRSCERSDILARRTKLGSRSDIVTRPSSTAITSAERLRR
jgi:hypothetical protein